MSYLHILSKPARQYASPSAWNALPGIKKQYSCSVYF